MNLWNILGDIVILLTASLCLGGLLSKLRQSPIVGYLIAGMLLGGPGSIGLVKSQHEIEAIAELGIALLLFSLGLEFSLKRVIQLGFRPLLGGMLQVLLTTLIAAAVCLAFGMSVKASVAFGVMISLSSTAVVLRILSERAEMDMPHGRNSLAVLLTQDMAVVPLALIMTLLAGEGGIASAAMDAGKLLLAATALVTGLYLITKIAVPALAMLSLHRNRELTVIFAVVTGLAAAWAAHAAGMSPALGAFIAGMLLGSSAFANQIRADVSSLRVVLLTLFFGAVGMVADPVWIVRNWYFVGGVTALLMIGKIVIIWAIFRTLGHTSRVAAASGLCLAQIGEFAFVLGSIGRSNGVVSEELYALVVSASLVSFILSAMLVPVAPQFGRFVARKLRESADIDEPAHALHKPADIAIIGFGPAGMIAAKPLIDGSNSVVVIDLNHDGVRRAHQLGFRGEIGDATQGEVLEHLQLAGSKAVIITIPDHRSAMTILEQVRQQAPQAHVVVRSRYQMHNKSFTDAGAHVVVGDEEQVGERLARHLQSWLESHGGVDSIYSGNESD